MVLPLSKNSICGGAHCIRIPCLDKAIIEEFSLCGQGHFVRIADVEKAITQGFSIWGGHYKRILYVGWPSHKDSLHGKASI